MEELIIIRHGQSSHLIESKTGGWSDTPLTKMGREQAKLTGKKLQAMLKNKEYRLYSSDLSRARQTAEIIGGYINCEPANKFELRELNNGIAANKSREEARMLEIPITQPILDWVPYPEAESWNMLYARVARCMEEIKEEAHGIAVIVTHSNTANSIIQWWLQFSIEMIEKITFEIEPCSISHLTITNWSNNWTIKKINDTGHLGELYDEMEL